jgi:DNA-binding NtrC family response regulator
MLYFVNKFSNEQGRSSAAVAKKAERLIHKHLPPNIRSHENVTTWLVNNWNTYGDASL